MAGDENLADREVVVVGLTGGIGAGKSTLARLLGDRGADVVDVDAIGRDVVAPGGPGAEAVLARFGTLDRRELASIVFGDDSARRELEAISWPLIEAELRRRVASSTADVVVLDMAVLAQGLGKGIYGPVVTVEASEDIRVARLIERGMTQADARARMRAQVSESARRALASLVIVNDGPPAALAAEADLVLRSVRSDAVPGAARVVRGDA